MIEKWIPVPGYEGSYEISDLGRLRRLTIFTGSLRDQPLIIKPHKKKSGYNDYWLWKDGKKKRSLAHRLVWRCFQSEIPKGMHLNHKNGVKDDNRLANLEVLTPSENTAYSFRFLGRKPPNNPNPGERNGSAKLTDDKVLDIRRLYDTGMHTQKSLGKQFGVSQVMIGLIVRREKWTHI